MRRATILAIGLWVFIAIGIVVIYLALTAQPTITVTGCAASPGSFPVDGQVHTISANSNCVITLNRGLP